MDSTGMELGFMGGQVMGSGMGVYLVLTIPAMLLSLYAQWRVKSAFSQWSQRANQRGLTGAEAAADMLAREGVRDVRIERVDGFLSDHYDPRDKVLRLSSAVFDERSVAALGIACHEAGHALQHAHGYGPLGFMRDELKSELTSALRPQDLFMLLEPYYAGGTSSFKPHASEVVDGWALANVVSPADRAAAAALLRREVTPRDIVLVCGARDNTLPQWALELTSLARASSEQNKSGKN